jgi:hypothetical protein
MTTRMFVSVDLLLTSGRITECDKPLITDDDMFLTR